MYLCYGTSGAGKTRWAKEKFPDYWVYTPATSGTYFDTYNGEECLILDEFSGTTIPLWLILQLLDTDYIDLPCRGRVKVGSFTKVVITTNVLPSAWYNYNERTSPLSAVIRRIHHFLYFPVKYNNETGASFHECQNFQEFNRKLEEIPCYFY